MALVPIQPHHEAAPTEKERQIVMEQLLVSCTKRSPSDYGDGGLWFAPASALLLLGSLMLGNLFRECGVTGRLSDTAQTP